MSNKERNIEEKLFFMKRKFWALTIFFLQGLILILMLGCFGSGSWVKQGTGDFAWKGGLLRVTEGSNIWNAASNYDSYSGMEYIDMQASCSNLYSVSKCSLFKNLKEAGQTFCFFEVFSYAFTVVWMIKIVFIIIQKPFLDKFTYVWPGAGLFCHVLAEIIWSGVTKASFSGSCSDITSDNLCSTEGPAGVLAITCFYIVTFAIFFIFHFKRFIPDDEIEGQRLDNN